MRKTFAEELRKQMFLNERIYLLVGDVGFGIFDEIRKDFPKRFFDFGVSEQAMIGIATGMAYERKIPVVYSLTPFLLYRPYEFIRTLINYDKANVKLIVSGRGNDYDDHNFTHLSPEEKKIVGTLENIKAFWPKAKEEIPSLVEKMIKGNIPYYINLRRH